VVKRPVCRAHARFVVSPTSIPCESDGPRRRLRRSLVGALRVQEGNCPPAGNRQGRPSGNINPTGKFYNRGTPTANCGPHVPQDHRGPTPYGAGPPRTNGRAAPPHGKERPHQGFEPPRARYSAAPLTGQERGGGGPGGPLHHSSWSPNAIGELRSPLWSNLRRRRRRTNPHKIRR